VRKSDKIWFTKGKTGQTGFKNYQFDFITVARAIHWFDLEEFNSEVLRVAKTDLMGTFKM
jgi:ubiquinone/menaquinone biosynthesis C-methylase UbiE